jgi:uncharacterized protein (TIGR00730 family)
MENTQQQRDDFIQDTILKLIEFNGGDGESYESELVKQIIETALKLLTEKHDLGQLKVISRAIKEMRYAYRVFNNYKTGPCISIFGSARTPEDHSDYTVAKKFSSAMAQEGWMCITGAANGIMKACVEGPEKEQSFGLSIRLPFETPTNTVIEGDPKLIFFRFFFTRKLMFMSHSQAMAAFPGGYGTMDEVFEMLTLIQTGKSNIIPIVLLEGKKGTYWQEWKNYVTTQLLQNLWISPEDESLFYIAPSSEEAVKHILKFYSRYHSSRYVKDMLVLRLLRPLKPNQIQILNDKFDKLVAKGSIEAVSPLPEETDHLELPRLAFVHTRKDFALLRRMIDQINEFEYTETQ